MREKKASLFVRAAGIAGLLFVFGVTFSGAAPAKKLYPGKIIIGAVVWPGYVGLYTAEAKGYFKEQGLNVEIRSYDGLSELSKDYVSGKMQGRANITFDAVKEYTQGYDQRVVLAIDYTVGADAIISRKDIASMGDLRGKRVAYETGTLEEFFLTWALSENGLKISDIVTVNANPEQAALHLKNGEADVAVTYEPFVSKFVTSEGFHELYSSANAPGLLSDALTFRTEFVEKYPETIQAILHAYFKALNFWKMHPDEALAIVAKRVNDEPGAVEQQLKKIRVLDLRENRVAFTFAAGVWSLYGNLREIARFIERSIPGSQAIRTDPMIDSRFIRGVLDEVI